MAPLGVSLAAAWMAALSATSAQDPAPVEDVHERMRALLLEIEQGLRAVDAELWRAGESRFVLREVTDRAQRVVDDIDLLLEIAHHPHDGGGGT